MIEEERSPALRRRAPGSGHVLGYRGLAYVDAELEEFSMDARSAPERICQAHLADQLPNFERHLGPADSSSRFPAPEHAKTSAMPAQNRLRLDDREGIQNTRRDPIQAYENQAIEAAQDRPLRRPSVQYIQLMAQGQVLCPKRCSRPEQPDEHPPDQIEQVPHAPFMARFEFRAKRTGFTTATGASSDEKRSIACADGGDRVFGPVKRRRRRSGASESNFRQGQFGQRYLRASA